jgi:hypothetical protein
MKNRLAKMLSQDEANVESKSIQHEEDIQTAKIIINPDSGNTKDEYSSTPLDSKNGDHFSPENIAIILFVSFLIVIPAIFIAYMLYKKYAISKNISRETM